MTGCGNGDGNGVGNGNGTGIPIGMVMTILEVRLGLRSLVAHLGTGLVRATLEPLDQLPYQD